MFRCATDEAHVAVGRAILPLQLRFCCASGAVRLHSLSGFTLSGKLSVVLESPCLFIIRLPL